MLQKNNEDHRKLADGDENIYNGHSELVRKSHVFYDDFDLCKYALHQWWKNSETLWFSFWPINFVQVSVLGKIQIPPIKSV